MIFEVEFNQSDQVLNVEFQDFQVVQAPIPSNYGLITYNGYELTVS